MLFKYTFTTHIHLNATSPKTSNEPCQSVIVITEVRKSQKNTQGFWSLGWALAHHHTVSFYLGGNVACPNSQSTHRGMSSSHFLVEDMVTGKELELTISSTSLIIVVCYDSWDFGVLSTFSLNSFHIDTGSRKSAYHQGPEGTETDFPGGTVVKNAPANQCRGQEFNPRRSHKLQTAQPVCTTIAESTL